MILKSQNHWALLCLGLILVHILDLFILPYGTMCDSLAYISYGFNLAQVSLFAPDQVPFPSYASNPYFPIGYPLILGSFISLFHKSFFLPVYIFQHILILFAQILFLKLIQDRKFLLYLSFILFLATPEFHIYPQSIMSEGPSISLHAILILSFVSLLKKDTKLNYFIFFISSILLIMIRIMPFPVIVGTLSLLFISKQINLRSLIKFSLPAFLGIALIPTLNYFFINKPLLTTSSGKHLHDRTIFSHKFPLIQGNQAQEKIVSLIGEDKYRRPHWEVEHSLADAGLDMGMEVDSLLKEASKPYFKLYPLEVLKKTFEFSWETLSSNNDHEFGIPAKYMTDLLAKEQEVYKKPFGDLWGNYLKLFKQNYISYIYLLILALCSLQTIIFRSNLHNLVISLYPLIGIGLSSSISWADPRRLREFLLCMLILGLLGIKSFYKETKD